MLKSWWRTISTIDRCLCTRVKWLKIDKHVLHEYGAVDQAQHYVVPRVRLFSERQNKNKANHNYTFVIGRTSVQIKVYILPWLFGGALADALYSSHKLPRTHRRQVHHLCHSTSTAQYSVLSRIRFGIGMFCSVWQTQRTMPKFIIFHCLCILNILLFDKQYLEKNKNINEWIMRWMYVHGHHQHTHTNTLNCTLNCALKLN